MNAGQQAKSSDKVISAGRSFGLVVVRFGKRLAKGENN
jgi:hypothetical protein